MLKKPVTCVLSGIFSGVPLSVNGSVSVNVTAVTFETGWRNASLFLWEEQAVVSVHDNYFSNFNQVFMQEDQISYQVQWQQQW